VFNILLGRGNDVDDEISTSPNVASIPFTGSTATGKLIERGHWHHKAREPFADGNSATIVLDDADLTSALPMAINAAFMNNGQS